MKTEVATYNQIIVLRKLDVLLTHYLSLYEHLSENTNRIYLKYAASRFKYFKTKFKGEVHTILQNYPLDPEQVEKLEQIIAACEKELPKYSLEEFKDKLRTIEDASYKICLRKVVVLENEDFQSPVCCYLKEVKPILANLKQANF